MKVDFAVCILNAGAGMVILGNVRTSSAFLRASYDSIAIKAAAIVADVRRGESVQTLRRETVVVSFFIAVAQFSSLSLLPTSHEQLRWPHGDNRETTNATAAREYDFGIAPDTVAI